MGTGRVILGVLALLALATAARAQERLVLGPYPGGPWREVVNQSKGLAFVIEQLPVGQTPENFHDVITAQSIPGFQGTPAAFISRAFVQYGADCETVETRGPTIDVEQERAVAYGQFYCGRQKGEAYGVHIFFKAILGNNGLYVVDRDFRTQPSPHASVPAFDNSKDAIAFLEAEGMATRYLKEQVYLCDPLFPDPRCAAATAAKPGQ